MSVLYVQYLFHVSFFEPFFLTPFQIFRPGQPHGLDGDGGPTAGGRRRHARALVLGGTVAALGAAGGVVRVAGLLLGGVHGVLPPGPAERLRLRGRAQLAVAAAGRRAQQAQQEGDQEAGRAQR